MYFFCRLLGHDLGAFPVAIPELNILGTSAVLVDVYRCRRCGDQVLP